MTFPLALDVRSEAVFSDDRKDRFLLLRVWNEDLPRLGCCLTNPSKADENLDDPTVRKMQAWARMWGYGSLVVTNAFSWRATDPRELRTRVETPGTIKRNFEAIENAAANSDLFICGWGRNGLVDSRHKFIAQILSGMRAHALRLIVGGHPEHPLYLPLKLVPFEVTLPA